MGDSGAIFGREHNGRWWSRRATSSSAAFTLATYVNNGTAEIHPAYGWRRDGGRVVRCATDRNPETPSTITR